jgi:hypothetical protein
MEINKDYITSMPRADQERRGCIRTFSGLYVNPLNLRDCDIRIVDIAHHLSNICRYTGACPQFYSVAQHSVYVSSLMYDMHGTAEAALAGLLHDAAEAYFNDLASPVKHDPRMQWYRDLEHGATELIFKRYSVDPIWLPIVKACDDKAFRDEVATWWNGATHIVPLQPKPAEMFFLNEFRSLQKRMGA